MKRILFLVLWIILVFASRAHAGIEIYANGQKYDSLKAYKLFEKLGVVHIPVGRSIPKSYQVGQKNLSDASWHQLYVLSVENGMAGVLRDFYQTWGQSQSIASEQLQEAIQQVVTSSKSPKLLISGPGKLRIMALSAANN